MYIKTRLIYIMQFIEEIYWCKQLQVNIFEMYITYVYYVSDIMIKVPLNIKKLKQLLKNSKEFRHFIDGICNQYYRYYKHNYDFIFSSFEGKIILSLMSVYNDKITNLFLCGTHNDKNKYLIEFENWNYKIH
jgi:hypothetical protein